MKTKRFRRQQKLEPLFQMGELYISPESIDLLLRPEDSLSQNDIVLCLARHLSGDWGRVGPFRWLSNTRAVTRGRIIISCYYSRRNIPFLIVTQGDRSVTIISVQLCYLGGL